MSEDEDKAFATLEREAKLSKDADRLGSARNIQDAAASLHAELSALRARGETAEATLRTRNEMREEWLIERDKMVDETLTLRARAEAAERRLLPEKLSDEQREMLAMALHEYGSPSLHWIDACDIAGYDVMVAYADAFRAILSRIEKENADG
jgi:isopropylmalate/homocitrate/citramalate synthase